MFGHKLAIRRLSLGSCLQAVFSMVKFSEVEEDVNRVLFAAKIDLLHGKLSKKSAQTSLETLATGLTSDQLAELVDEISSLDLRS